MKFKIDSLNGKYEEPCDIMTHAIFQCLINYIEKNKGYKVCPTLTQNDLNHLGEHLSYPDYIQMYMSQHFDEVDLWNIYVWWKNVFLPRYNSNDIDELLETQLDQYRKRVFELRPMMWS